MATHAKPAALGITFETRRDNRFQFIKDLLPSEGEWARVSMVYGRHGSPGIDRGATRIDSVAAGPRHCKCGQRHLPLSLALS